MTEKEVTTLRSGRTLEPNALGLQDLHERVLEATNEVSLPGDQTPNLNDSLDLGGPSGDQDKEPYQVGIAEKLQDILQAVSQINTTHVQAQSTNPCSKNVSMLQPLVVGKVQNSPAKSSSQLNVHANVADLHVQGTGSCNEIGQGVNRPGNTLNSQTTYSPQFNAFVGDRQGTGFYMDQGASSRPYNPNAQAVSSIQHLNDLALDRQGMASSSLRQNVSSTRHVSYPAASFSPPLSVQPTSGYQDARASASVPQMPKDYSRSNQNMPKDYSRSNQNMTKGYSRSNQNIPKMKPPIYDGLTSWPDYLLQFEMIAELHEWNDETKAMCLAMSLRGVAQSILGDLSVSARHHYPSLIACLGHRFGPENQTDMFWVLLNNRTQRPDETLPELAHEIRKLVKLAHPSAEHLMLEDLAKKHFMNALADAGTRLHIVHGKPFG